MDANVMTLEYAYFGFTDTYSYDLRRDTTCSNDAVVNRGVDYWMTGIQDFSTLRKLVDRGANIANLLKIRLTNRKTKQQASMSFFDLLRPNVASKDKNVETDSNHIRQEDSSMDATFHQLRVLVNRLLGAKSEAQENKYRGSIAPWDPFSESTTGLYVLTDLLTHFLCGHHPLAVFCYLNECLRQHRRETTFALDFVSSLRQLQTISLKNPLIFHHHPRDLDDNNYKAGQWIRQREKLEKVASPPPPPLSLETINAHRSWFLFIYYSILDSR
ncbi:hypothetical protein BDF20DRAFT_590044 [Mycotypha africana]|uniref:uncharacterized protein n=1 Tax=Mycotypha africana TaxID=64632 RepID=UPI0023004353|nr:uncharacterized protein BDF20DRAFT_590044 [Mycotypha africana]KAI8975166.1 hypothetical protein BDF20DRAFT_590044 [Mycotypha africana]